MGSAVRRFSESLSAIGVSKVRLALWIVAGALAGVACGFCLLAIQSLLVSSIVAASLFAIVPVGVLFIYAMAQSRKQTLAAMRAELQPKLKVLGIRQRINSVNIERSFDLVVRNEGSEPIENCSAAVSSIRMVRFAGPRGDRTVDISGIYDQEVPLALAVPSRANEYHSFSLRPREMQRIPICSRIDGPRNRLTIHLAADVAEPLKLVPDFAFGEIGITIFGGPSELEERLHLSVRETGVLEVLRSN